MSEILLVNPRRRRKSHAKRRRNPARKRRHVARKRKAVTVTVKANPRRRYSRRVHRAIRRHRRRNPSFRGITGQIVPTVKSGFVGALGALGLDVLAGYTTPKLPASLQAGAGKWAVKALGAVLVGVLGNVVMRGKGRDLANGAMTVVIHDALKEQVATYFPTIALGEYFAPGYNVGNTMQIPGALGTGVPPSAGVGMYFNPLAGMGAYGEDDSVAYGGGY